MNSKGTGKKKTLTLRSLLIILSTKRLVTIWQIKKKKNDPLGQLPQLPLDLS